MARPLQRLRRKAARQPAAVTSARSAAEQAVLTASTRRVYDHATADRTAPFQAVTDGFGCARRSRAGLEAYLRAVGAARGSEQHPRYPSWSRYRTDHRPHSRHASAQLPHVACCAAHVVRKDLQGVGERRSVAVGERRSIDERHLGGVSAAVHECCRRTSRGGAAACTAGVALRLSGESIYRCAAIGASKATLST